MGDGTERHIFLPEENPKEAPMSDQYKMMREYQRELNKILQEE